MYHSCRGASLVLILHISLSVAWLTMVASLAADIFPSSVGGYSKFAHVSVTDNESSAIKRIKRVLLMVALPVRIPFVYQWNVALNIQCSWFTVGRCGILNILDVDPILPIFDSADKPTIVNAGGLGVDASLSRPSSACRTWFGAIYRLHVPGI